jgi:hypothetical protein
MTLGHGHLDKRQFLAGAHLADEPAHGCLGDIGPVLFDQALPDAPGRVALLAGR